MGKTNQRALYSTLAPYYDLIAPPTTAQECKFLNNVFQNYKNKIVKILDLGCGTGRHACGLEKMGYKVTGIDLAKEMLKIARSKCPKVEFKEMNFTSPRFPQNSFDASICMWTTIGYILSERKFKQFIKNIASITKYLLVLDSSNYENPKKTKLFIKERKIIKHPKVTIKTLTERQYDAKTKFRDDIYITTLIEKGKKPVIFKERERLRMWSVEELEILLKPEFRILNIYGDYSLKKKYLPKTSRRKIIVAEKTQS